MSHRIELYKSLSAPGNLAYAALRSMLDLGKNSADSAIAHAAALGIQGFHILGDPILQVPIALDAQLVPIRWEANIEIAAQRHPSLYPRFSGTLSITPNGIDHSELWLIGDYEAPLGVVGDIVDRTLFRDVAEGSLSDFVGRLSTQIEAQVKKTQAEHERAIRTMHNG